MLIDSHAHLFFDDFKGEVETVIDRARQVGVSTLINVGTDAASRREFEENEHSRLFKFIGTLIPNTARQRIDW